MLLLSGGASAMNDLPERVLPDARAPSTARPSSPTRHHLTGPDGIAADDAAMEPIAAADDGSGGVGPG
jgi:hypothetical protein